MMKQQHAESAQNLPNPMTNTVSTSSMIPLRLHSKEETGVHVYASENPRIMKQGARTIDYNIANSTLSHSKADLNPSVGLTGPSIETDEMRPRFQMFDSQPQSSGMNTI